jgi:hypothetical protein
MKKVLVLIFALVLCLPGLPATAAANPFNQFVQTAPDSTYSDASSSYYWYYFTFYYSNGSGDYYNGGVGAPTGIISVGQYVYDQPAPMGGASLGGGYYYITSSYSYGSDSSYDGYETIYSYYDADTKTTSSTLYSSTGQSTATHYLNVSDRRYSSESGYVYDPLVPASDAYFGNSDICYSFSTSSNSANFLATYITGLRYWNQPDDYQNSCQEVASAILLSFWDKNGYGSAITTDWETNWPNNTANLSSYETLLKCLGTIMNYDSINGTDFSTWGPGLVTYLQQQGYSSGFSYTNYSAMDNRSSAWTAFKTALNAGRPGAIRMYWSSGGHAVVGRGYWNDGHILVDMGWGTGSYANEKVDWNSTTYGSTYETAQITHFCDFHH